jgi:GNAT superfamily N-acetyltransferase
MTPKLVDVSRDAVIAAMDANLSGHVLSYSRLPHGCWYDDGRLVWCASGVRERWFNGVVRARLDPTSVGDAIDGVLAEFGRRDLPMLWRIGPTSRPTTLGATLLTRGFVHDRDDPGMALELATMEEIVSVPSDLTIEQVFDNAVLHAWTAVWMDGVPEPARQRCRAVYDALGVDPTHPWRYYLGRLDGEPVATLKLFYDAGVISVQHVTTLPHARHRGIATALTTHALQEAREQGYRIAVLTSTPAGFNCYRRIGFREYCRFSSYYWHPGDTG